MTRSREIALDLMRRLISGERGEISLNLSLLLERSLLLAGSDETQYLEILPPELANIKLSAKTRDEIISTLCAQVLQEPDVAIVAAMSFAGTDLVTKTMFSLLTKPPRPLTLCETAHALSIVAKFLPSNLAANSQLLSRVDLNRLVSVLKEMGEAEGSLEGQWHIEIEHHAGNLLQSLALLGIG